MEEMTMDQATKATKTLNQVLRQIPGLAREAGLRKLDKIKAKTRRKALPDLRPQAKALIPGQTSNRSISQTTQSQNKNGNKTGMRGVKNHPSLPVKEKFLQEGERSLSTPRRGIPQNSSLQG
jgi:hypothetical protein